jgi:uncharacterized protein (TIGR00730 family)
MNISSPSTSPAPQLPAPRVCVYCASSRTCHADFHAEAYRVGRILAENSFTIVYGGGAVGSMGALADGALSVGGQIIGVLPRFMAELEWGHTQLSELRIVEDMRARKHAMLTDSVAVIALPGGSGTLEELMEALTLKRLGIYLNPILLVNTHGFFDPLVELLDHCIRESFMDPRHRAMWQVVPSATELLKALRTAPKWSAEARAFAAL